MKSIRAFTLIEVLIAVVIFSIVLAAINTVFYSALHLRSATTRALDQSAGLQQTLAILRRDLQGAVQPGGVFAGDFKSGGVSGGIGVSQSSGLDFFTCTAAINDDAPWGDIQRVTYELRQPMNRTTPKGLDLIRSVTRNLLPTTTEEPVEQWLMGDVESLTFECYNGTDWRETWDTTMGDSGLPQAVRMKIQLAAQDGTTSLNRQPQEMLVMLETQSRTNSTQSTGGAQ